MIPVFSSTESAVAFVIAAFVLAVTPGPGVGYIVTRTLAQGRAAGLASVFGVGAGNFGNAVAASLGLAAVLVVSSAAFLTLKYAGAAYLVYLGVRAIINKKALEVSASVRRIRKRRVFFEGFWVALLNPKTALFFAAFLPQFVVPNPTVYVLVLVGGIFVGIALLTDAAYVFFASQAAAWFRRRTQSRKALSFLPGGALIGLGVLAAFSGSHPAQEP